jgi:thiol-disulfide isomerase/thioredoxin
VRGVRADAFPCKAKAIGTVAVVRRILVLAALVPCVACSSETTETDLPANVAVVSGRAPAVSGQVITGGRLEPADYRGAALVVNFFNPFCPPCRREQQTLTRDSLRLGGDEVQFVGVHYVGGQWPASVAAARSYVRTRHVPYPVIEDRASRLSRALAIQGIPSTVVIDAAGRMRFRILGSVRPGELERLLRSLSLTRH